MKHTYSYVQAIRAIIALFVQRTIGRLFLAVALIALVITLLASYNAAAGLSLLWVLVAMGVLTTLLTGALAGLIYFTTWKILPRKLESYERKFIVTFTRKLQNRLELLRVPLPLFVFNLFVTIAVEAKHSKERKKLESTIAQSRSLSDDFKTIISYFQE